MTRLRLTAADVLAATIGALIGWIIVLGIAESTLRRRP